MSSRYRVRVIVLAVLAVAAIAYAAMQFRAEPEAPASGADLSQVVTKAPKMVAPYAPTEDQAVATMLEMAQVGPRDYLMDLGSGDGRIPIAAARERQARALGVDIDPARIRDSRINAERAGVADRVRFQRQDLFETPIADATVLTLFLSAEINERLRQRILAEMRPGTRVVSNTFDMGDWQHDLRRLAGNQNIYLWYVPAQVDGDWILRVGGRSIPLEIDQEYQQIIGAVNFGGRDRPFEHGLIRGDKVRFVADVGGGRRLFDGRLINGKIVPITGERPSYPVQPATGWEAVRRPG